jgi:hypothetical protein
VAVTGWRNPGAIARIEPFAPRPCTKVACNSTPSAELCLCTGLRSKCICAPFTSGNGNSFDWGEDDYAVVDETQVVDERQIGRIYKERVPAGVKWLWFLQVVEAPLPNKGIADTLDEAKAALAKRYEEVKRLMTGRNATNFSQ